MSGPRSLPPAVWVLGFVSLLMDVSSELVHSLLPVFMVGTMKAGVLSVGLLEGAAEASALFAKVFSGALSDRQGRRKPLALAGYGLSALAKPLFPLAHGLGGVLLARFVDRVGKGLRGAPRDALLADVAPPGRLGEAYGLRQSLDSVGAVIGPLLAVGLMAAVDFDARAVMWAAAVPGTLAVALLAVGVSEPRRAAVVPARARPDWSAWRRLSPAYWRVVAAGFIFASGRFSEAFLILRARDNGLPDSLTPLVLVLMSVCYAASAHPAGLLADRLPKTRLLAAGAAVLAAADVSLALARGLPLTALGCALWGLHLGLTQGVFSALVAGHVPSDLRGTAFGVFHLASGLGLLAASALAGLLWQKAGAPAAFWTAAALAVLSAAALPGAWVALRSASARQTAKC